MRHTRGVPVASCAHRANATTIRGLAREVVLEPDHDPCRHDSALLAVVTFWDNAWEEFVPFLDYDIKIRTVLCSTNTIESLNARYLRVVKAR